jgi:hypothetical protein
VLIGIVVASLLFCLLCVSAIIWKRDRPKKKKDDVDDSIDIIPGASFAIASEFPHSTSASAVGIAINRVADPTIAPAALTERGDRLWADFRRVVGFDLQYFGNDLLALDDRQLQDAFAILAVTCPTESFLGPLRQVGNRFKAQVITDVDKDDAILDDLVDFLFTSMPDVLVEQAIDVCALCEGSSSTTLDDGYEVPQNNPFFAQKGGCRELLSAAAYREVHMVDPLYYEPEETDEPEYGVVEDHDQQCVYGSGAVGGTAFDGDVYALARPDDGDGDEYAVANGAVEVEENEYGLATRTSSGGDLYARAKGSNDPTYDVGGGAGDECDYDIATSTQRAGSGGDGDGGDRTYDTAGGVQLSGDDGNDAHAMAARSTEDMYALASSFNISADDANEPVFDMTKPVPRADNNQPGPFVDIGRRPSKQLMQSYETGAGASQTTYVVPEASTDNDDSEPPDDHSGHEDSPQRGVSETADGGGALNDGPIRPALYESNASRTSVTSADITAMANRASVTSADIAAMANDFAEMEEDVDGAWRSQMEEEDNRGHLSSSPPEEYVEMLDDNTPSASSASHRALPMEEDDVDVDVDVDSSSAANADGYIKTGSDTSTLPRHPDAALDDYVETGSIAGTIPRSAATLSGGASVIEEEEDAPVPPVDVEDYVDLDESAGGGRALHATHSDDVAVGETHVNPLGAASRAGSVSSHDSDSSVHMKGLPVESI